MDKKYTYKVEKFDQWLAIRKRAQAEGLDVFFSQEDFYDFIRKNRQEFITLADQSMTPYVTRRDETIAYQLGNLKIVGKPRNKSGVRCTSVTDPSDVKEFTSIRALARDFHFGKRQITKAMQTGLPYKGYLMEKGNG